MTENQGKLMFNEYLIYPHLHKIKFIFSKYMS